MVATLDTGEMSYLLHTVSAWVFLISTVIACGLIVLTIRRQQALQILAASAASAAPVTASAASATPVTARSYQIKQAGLALVLISGGVYLGLGFRSSSTWLLHVIANLAEGLCVLGLIAFIGSLALDWKGVHL